MKKRLRSASISKDIEMPEIPLLKQRYDKNINLTTSQHIKDHTQRVTLRLSPESKRTLKKRQKMAQLQLIDREARPLDYYNRYQDLMTSIERTEHKLPETRTSVVVAITAICLCHGKIAGSINSHIDPSITLPSRPTVKRNPRKNGYDEIVKYDYTVNYGKKSKGLEFTYSTVPYCGVFTNVGSCPGLPTFAPPNSFFNEQNIVTHEYNLLTCDETTSPEKCQPYMLSLAIDPTISRKLKETRVTDVVESDHLFLSMHDDYLCKSLLNKCYEVKHSDLLTEDLTITRGDSGKFILLTKIKHTRGKIEEYEIVKTVILGSINFQEELELLGRKTKKDLSDFMRMVDVDIDVDTYYITTTERIVVLINRLKDGDIPVRFFDSSCNMYSGIDYENPTPFVMLELEKLNRYFLNESRQGEAVYGGNANRLHH